MLQLRPSLSSGHVTVKVAPLALREPEALFSCYDGGSFGGRTSDLSTNQRRSIFRPWILPALSHVRIVRSETPNTTAASLVVRYARVNCSIIMPLLYTTSRLLSSSKKGRWPPLHTTTGTNTRIVALCLRWLHTRPCASTEPVYVKARQLFQARREPAPPITGKRAVNNLKTPWSNAGPFAG